VAEINIKISKAKFLPCYHHLLPSENAEDFDMEYIYGSRDSGKSRHTAMQLIIDCMRLPEFRCLLIRKVMNTVRDSQYSLIQSIVEEWGLTNLFKFNSSRLEITCINGNAFFGRGLDDVQRIKSFNNPSVVWIEEGSQITREDLVVILTSLRNNNTRVKTWFTFNPECEVSYTEFWLWLDYFSHTEDLSFTTTKKIQISEDEVAELKIRATHTTWRDNPYCTPQRKALYESYKTSKNNAYWYRVYSLGEWGIRRPGGEFYKSFDEDMHTVDLLSIPAIKNRQWTLHISADNNVAPYIAIQIMAIDIKGKAILQLGEISCTHPNNTATKAGQQVVNYLEKIKYNDKLFIGGDPSANARSTTDDEGKSFFDKFIGVIKSAGYDYVDKVGRSAPSVSQSGSFVNEIFEHNYLGWKIFIDKKCVKSIEDYNMAVEAADGSLLKKRITDKVTGQSYEKYGHYSDLLRYGVVTLLKDEYQQFLQRRRGMPLPGGVVSAQKVKPKLG
jgi:PBSX family phage terminase large subunit